MYCDEVMVCTDLSFGQLHKHLGCRLDDRHLVQDGGSIIGDDDLSIRLADLHTQMI